jgi:hypothetical protein
MKYCINVVREVCIPEHAYANFHAYPSINARLVSLLHIYKPFYELSYYTNIACFPLSSTLSVPAQLLQGAC